VVWAVWAVWAAYPRVVVPVDLVAWAVLEAYQKCPVVVLAV
jgi:hypothetical protein